MGNIRGMVGQEGMKAAGAVESGLPNSRIKSFDE